MLRPVLTLTLLSLCLPSTVLAQTGRDDRSRNRELQVFLQSGVQFFRNGQFSSAADAFQQAYTLGHQPELLFNVGMCFENAGKLSEAIEAYDQFLAAGAPGHPAPNELRDHVQALHRRLEAQQAPPSSDAGAGPSTGNAGDAAVSPQSSQPPQQQLIVVEYRRNIVTTVVPIALVGVGLALGGVGIWQGVQAGEHIATVSAANTGSQPWDQNASDAYRLAQVNVPMAWGFGIGGGILALGGAAWLLFQPSTEQRQMITATVSPLPGGAALTVGGRF